jgi:hypothetical protein
MPICGAGLLPFLAIVSIVGGMARKGTVSEVTMLGYTGGPSTLLHCGFASSFQVSVVSDPSLTCPPIVSDLFGS